MLIGYIEFPELSVLDHALGMYEGEFPFCFVCAIQLSQPRSSTSWTNVDDSAIGFSSNL